MNNDDKNIVLIGMPGCGKTTIGELLANKLGREFIDIDNYIETQEGCTINQLFQKGEHYFRDLETKAVLALEKKKASVITTGGGIVKNPLNMESLKKNGIIIYLDRRLSDIAADIDRSTRPLLSSGIDKLAELYCKRQDLYKGYSDFIVKNQGEMAMVVENIIEIANVKVIGGI